MFKSTLRGAARATITSRTTSGALRNIGGRRFASSGPSKKRTWKSGAARWMVAGAGVWWYNTSDVFKEDPAEAAIQRTNESLHRIQESDSPTIDAIVEEKRARAAERVADDEKRQKAAESAVVTENGEAPAEEGEDGMGGLEEEADQQGAFNPETGEINWDCPCLGGMAHGPCGDEFRAAFSCFVYSKEEPKGVECIEKFKQHPEMYGSELEDDEDEVEEELRARESAKNEEAALTAPKETSESSPKPTPETTSQPKEPKKEVKEPHRDSLAATTESAQKAGDEGGELVPKSAHDAT